MVISGMVINTHGVPTKNFHKNFLNNCLLIPQEYNLDFPKDNHRNYISNSSKKLFLHFLGKSKVLLNFIR